MPSKKLAEKKRIKILFVDHTPFVGGAQLCLARDIAYLDRKKFEPFLAIDKASKFDYVYKHSKVKTFKISFGKLKKIDPTIVPQLLNSIKEFLELVEKIKPDIVFANTTRALILVGLAKDYKIALKLLKKPSHHFKLINFVRDYDYPKWLFNTLKVSVDKFLMVSKSIESHYGQSKPKSEVVYLGTDIHKKLQIKNAKLQIEKAKKQYKIERGDFVVGFVGRLVDWKGPKFLLDSFKKIKDPEVKLIYFGSGKGQPGDIEEKLKKEVKKRKLENRVVFAGFVEDQNLIYKLIDVFVLASLKPEPFATNLAEAALSKLPIVATYTGGTPEFIKSGKNGLIVKPKDTSQLSQALLRLRKDKRLAQKLAGSAYKDGQKFKEEKFIKNLENIFAKMISVSSR
jgi:glycosyltransferase involved in cell wall biosynthesis